MSLQEIRRADASFRKAADDLFASPNSKALMESARERYETLCRLAPAMTIPSDYGFRKTLFALLALVQEETEQRTVVKLRLLPEDFPTDVLQGES